MAEPKEDQKLAYWKKNLEKAQKDSQDQTSDGNVAEALMKLAEHMLDLNLNFEAGDNFEKALDVFQKSRNVEGQKQSLIGLGKVAMAFKDYDSAVKKWKKCSELCVKRKKQKKGSYHTLSIAHTDPLTETICQIYVILAIIEKGELAEAKRYLIAIIEQMSEWSFLGQLQSLLISSFELLGKKLVELGENEEAMTLFSKWLEGKEKETEQALQGRMFCAQKMAEIYKERGRFAKLKEDYVVANEWYDLSLEIFEKLQDKKNLIEVYEALQKIELHIALSERAYYFLKKNSLEDLQRGETSKLNEFWPFYKLAITGMELVRAIPEKSAVEAEIKLKNIGNLTFRRSHPVSFWYGAESERVTYGGPQHSSCLTQIVRPGETYIISEEIHLKGNERYRGYATLNYRNRYENVYSTSYALNQEGQTQVLEFPETKTFTPQKATRQVFVSYSHKDQEVVQRFKNMLTNESIGVIIDFESMPPGQSIEEFIERSIAKTDYTISIISSNSLRSAYAVMESVDSISSEKRVGEKFIPCYIESDFFDRTFTGKAYDKIETEIADIRAKISEAKEKNRKYRDLEDELNRYQGLHENLVNIVAKLRLVKCIDISGKNLEENFAKIKETIKKGW